MSEDFQSFHAPEHQNVHRNGPSTFLTTFLLDHMLFAHHWKNTSHIIALGMTYTTGLKSAPPLQIKLVFARTGITRCFPWKWALEKEAVGVCQALSKLRSDVWHFLMHILNYNNRIESAEEELLQCIKGRSDRQYSCLDFLGNTKQYHLLIMLR